MSKAKRDDLLLQLWHLRKAADRGVAPTDDEFMERYPGLWQLYTLLWLDDTHRVEGASVTISNQLGDWSWRVQSPAMRGSKSVLVKTMGEGWLALEKAVWDPAIPWVINTRRRPSIREVKPPKNGLDEI